MTEHSKPTSPAQQSEMPPPLSPNILTALKSFTSPTSTTPFRILYTHPPLPLSPPSFSLLPIQKLFVLDSSFNPPSKAHGWIGTDAALDEVSRRRRLRQSQGQEQSQSCGGRHEKGKDWEGIRLLLLLATQNADKPAKPAGFDERVGMMILLARRLYAELLDVEQGRERDSYGAGGSVSGKEDKGGGETRGEGGAGGDDSDSGLGTFAIDVGVIKQPYFVDKAAAIEESGVYGDEGGFEQIHLTGYDTLMRIFDEKYYGEKGLDVLTPFLERGRIRAVLRPGGDWGELEEQRGWLGRLERGEMEGSGVRREWAGKVELVEDRDGVVGGVSSTRVREAVGRGDWVTVEELVGMEVMECIRERGLYVETERKEG